MNHNSYSRINTHSFLSICMIGLFFLFSLWIPTSVSVTDLSPNVIGWFVGNDIQEFHQVPWKYYTHIRIGNLQVSPNGTATCQPDSIFQEALTYSSTHPIQIVLGGGDINITRCSFSSGTYCETLYNTIQSAVRSCGPQVTGIEFDWEWGKQYINLFGYISQSHVIGFSSFLDKLQVALGTPYTVSCDVDLYLLGIISPKFNFDNKHQQCPDLFNIPGTSTTIFSGRQSMKFLFGTLTADSSKLVSSIIASIIGTILSLILLSILKYSE